MTNTKSAREILKKQMHDVAHKAQIDYVAVNSTYGVRHGESTELLANFIEANLEQALTELSEAMEWVIGKDEITRAMSSTNRNRLRTNQRKRLNEWLGQ